jgi:hypothetical protein
MSPFSEFKPREGKKVHVICISMNSFVYGISVTISIGPICGRCSNSNIKGVEYTTHLALFPGQLLVGPTAAAVLMGL